jgi:hypothetical protein
MTDPVTLIVLVAAGEAANPTTAAMVRATGDALGGAPVEVRETPGVPTDADALAMETESRASAVIELIWTDANQRQVILRVHLATGRRWVERSIGFMPSDPAGERGRTLGFAAASILPEAAHSPTRSDGLPTQPPAAPAPTPSEAPAEERAPRLDAPRPSSASPDTVFPPAATEASTSVLAPSPGTHRPHVEIDLLAVGGVGIGGNATGAGGGAAVGWFATQGLSLRVGASERAGSLDVAEATVFTLLINAGVALHPWRPTRSHPFGLSVRADYLLARQSATHFDSDDPAPVTRSRWLSGVDAVADVSWILSTEIEAILGIGLEDVLSPTYINVRDQRVANLPALRAVGEAGFRLRF